MTLHIDEIKQKSIPILREAGVLRSSLFGSYVRGEARDDSDIDILVEYPKNMTLFDVVDLKSKLEGATGKRVDLVGFSRIKARIKETILFEQIPLL